MNRSINWRAPVVAALVVLISLPGVAGAADEDDFKVDGGGWGHGVGMSQYGAFGMALDGEKVSDIIGHWYSGASLEPAQDLGTVPGWIFEPQALAVNVASQRDTLDFWVRSTPAGEGVSVCHRGDGTNSCATPDVVLTAGQRLRVEGGGSECTRRVIAADGSEVPDSAVDGNCSLDITWNDAFSGLNAETLVEIEELIYARGPLQVRPSIGVARFDTTVRLGLEEYLYGLGEVPLSWPVEALKSQVVAARSYAINTVAARGGADGSGRLAECGCHIRRTTADQNYDAWLVESADVFGDWREAVDDTAGLVVTHSGIDGGDSVVTTYYSSSTGGVTENVEDVFGGSPQPHLRSVSDPWGGDAGINPLARWRVTVPEPNLRAELCDLGSCWDKVTGGQMLSTPPAATIRMLGLVGRQVVSTEVPAVWLYRILNAQGSRVSPYIVGVIGPSPFLDIDTSIHRNDIVYIAEFGVTKGCNPPANDLYCPVQDVTRQQMASFLVRALGLGSANADAFVDDADSVHQGDINALAAAGITKGCNPPANDRFCPERAVTRGEMAAFLVRAYAYRDRGAGNLFIDDDSSIFQADIDRLAMAGVTNGCNPPANDRFCPTDAVTREQMASFIARAMRGAAG